MIPFLVELARWIAAGAVPMAVAGVAAFVVDRAAGPRLWPQAREALWTIVLVVPFVPALQEVSPAAWPAVGLGDFGVAGGADVSAAHPVVAWLAGGAALGVVLSFARTAVAFGLVWRRVARRGAAPSDALRDRVVALSRRVGRNVRPRLVVDRHADLGAPCVAFAGGPTVVLPAGPTTDAAIVHELVHVARRDPWRALVAELLAAGSWWHPAAWLARRRLTTARELACDARVVTVLEGGAEAYRAALVQTARRQLGTVRPAAAVAGFVTFPSAIRERLVALGVAPVVRGRARQRAGAVLLGGTVTLVAAGLRPPAAVPAAPAAHVVAPPSRALPAALGRSLPAALGRPLPLPSADDPGCLPLRYAVMQALARERFLAADVAAAPSTDPEVPPR